MKKKYSFLQTTVNYLLLLIVVSIFVSGCNPLIDPVKAWSLDTLILFV